MGYSACKNLPGDSATRCEKAVDEKGEQVAEMIKANKSEEEICQAGGYCPKEIRDVPDKCDVCKGYFKFVKQHVKPDASTEEIVEALYSACKNLPGDSATRCEKAVDEKGEQVAEMIKANKSEEEICQAGGYCPKEIRDVPDKCDVCKGY